MGAPMTSEQHLAMIGIIRAAIGQPDGPSQAEGERMIRNHEVMARVRKTFEMLTASEIESLRQNGKELSDYARNAFSHLRPKAP
jgi:hypothetical protein